METQLYAVTQVALVADLLLLRGRKAVRADRRLCTHEKAIRAQSTILDKNHAAQIFAAAASA
jgi:hypothetical protein